VHAACIWVMMTLLPMMSVACPARAAVSERLVIQKTKYTTLPKPPRRPGVASKATANAATNAMIGSVTTTNGLTSRSRSRCGSSPRTSCMIAAATTSTATIEASTAKLLATLPSR
jgi:hypothetical protein